MPTEPQGEIVRLDVQVKGRVHGVGFRYFAFHQAQGLGLVGWVANVRDGSVQCVAEGPREPLESFLAQLHEGPPAALVEGVSAAWMAATGEFSTFRVRSGAHRGD